MKLTNQQQFKKDFDSLNCFYLELDGVVHINLETDKLQVGGVTNAGFYPTYEIEIDYDFSFDENLQVLIESYQESELI